MNILRPIAKLLVHRPKTVLLVFTIFTILIGTQITRTYMVTDLAGYLPSNDPSIKLLGRIYDEFKIGLTIIVLVEADDIRNPMVLKEMAYVANRIDTSPYDEGKDDGVFSVKSLATSIMDAAGRTDIPDDENLIYTYMTLPTIAETKGILFTNDYKVGVIVIQLSKNADYEKILSDTKDAISHKGTSFSDMTLTGSVAVQKAMREQTFQSLGIVFGLALLFMIINMYLFHRNLKSFIIGFLPLGYSLILTFGVLGIVQPELSILTIAAAALLIGLGDDYSVYYSSRFTEECTIEDKIERIECTLKHTGKAVFMCAVATMIGFGSLMTSNMPPMVDFGFVCLLGTAFIFISATILVPCLCVILNYNKHEKNHHWKRFAGFIVDQRKRLFVIGCFFVILSLIVLPQVKTDVNLLDMAPKGLPEVDKLLEYSQKFGQGTNFNAIVVETDNQGLTDPKVIDAIYALETEIRNTGASAYSIADELKEVNEILNQSVIIQKLAELAKIDKIIFDKIAENGLVDQEYSKTLIVVSFPAGTGTEEIESLVDKINSISSSAVIPQNGKISQLVGQDVVTVDVNKQIMGTQVSSTLTELLLILTCLIIGFGSIRIGFLSLIPVLFVLAWEPGSLVMLSIPLSVINVTVAAIIFSTGIDYGIVTTQRLNEERAKGLSKIDALKKTLETSGWSIITASSTTMVALLATFAVNIPMLHQFSIIVIILYLFSIIASFCILPAVYASKWFK